MKNGIFDGYLSGREAAQRVGRNPAGSLRADGWHNIPIVRMINEESVRLRHETEYKVETLIHLGAGVFFILLFFCVFPYEPFGRIPYYSFWIFLFGIAGLVLYMKLFPN